MYALIYRIFCAVRDVYSVGIKLETYCKKNNTIFFYMVHFWLFYSSLSLFLQDIPHVTFSIACFRQEGEVKRSSTNTKCTWGPHWQLRGTRCAPLWLLRKQTQMLSLPSHSHALSLFLSLSLSHCCRAGRLLSHLHMFRQFCAAWKWFADRSVNTPSIRDFYERNVARSCTLYLCLSISLSLSHWQHLSACATKASFNAHLLKVQERRGE